MTTPSGRVNVGQFDVDSAAQATDFSEATVWQMVAMLDGAPIDQVAFASPGRATPRLVDAALRLRVADPWARELLYRELCERFGVGLNPPDQPSLAISVVVCTHGRPDYLPRLFDALSKLDPEPVEIIVVDNAPGKRDCRLEAERHGFHYVREDRKGLDNARNAGIRASRGDVVAFTDDDCVPAPGWLSQMPRLFADESVAAVTGPMFAFGLETRAQQRMDQLAGMVRGFDEVTFDWHNLSVAHGGAVGVGANMTIRRRVLDELGPEPFPPELDTGTPTGSGGDTYVFGRLIAENHRIVYSPATYGLHDHRGDDGSLLHAVHGYGIGVSSAMTRLLVVDREFEAWKGWAWLVKQHIRACWRWLGGYTDRRALAVGIQYLIGGMRGPVAWRRSLLEQRRYPPAEDSTEGRSRLLDVEPRAPANAQSVRRSEHAGAPHGHLPEITVVIPTTRFGTPLERCLASLADQTLSPDRFEVIVVDDRPGVATEADPESCGLTLRVLRTHGSGASAARNLGARYASASVVVFIDDDLVAAPEMLDEHLNKQHNAPRPVAVVAPYLPRPPRRGLATDSTSLWWSRHFEVLRRGEHPTYTWMLSGNLSVGRSEFLRLGGFPEEIPYRREDYEFGIRWLAADNDVVYAPDALALHEFEQSTETRLRGAEIEGAHDTIMNRIHPGISGTLPLVAHRFTSTSTKPRAVGRRLLRQDGVRTFLVSALGWLEKMKLRRLWLRLFRPLNSTSYGLGLDRSQLTPQEIQEIVVRCELTEHASVRPAAGLAPTVAVTLRSKAVITARPTSGLWDDSIARDISNRISSTDLQQLAAIRGWLPTFDDQSDLTNRSTADMKEVASIAVVPLPELCTTRDHLSRLNSDFLAVLLGTETDGGRDTWLAEGSLPFDGSRVGATIGAGILDEMPSQPVHLYGPTMRPALSCSAGVSYVMFRLEALERLPTTTLQRLSSDPLALTLSLVLGILDSGGTVGWRDVHGLLPGPRHTPREFGRACSEATLAATKHLPRAIARQSAKAVAAATSNVRTGATGPSNALAEAFGVFEGIHATWSARSNARGHVTTRSEFR